MRKLITILLALAITMTLLVINASAQGRGNGHGKGHGHGKHEWKDTHPHDGRYSYDRHEGGHYHVRDYHRPVYAHVHSHHCDHRIVVRHYERPRYVYYRDYDVYFDHHRNVYISYSGRGWTVSTSLPVHLHHVDLRATNYAEVDYYDDDFVDYVSRGRPIYGRVIYAHR